MARAGGSEHPAATRQALMAAARLRFGTQGYAATGTEEIVADAQVTRGALYHHFRDKADLFGAVMEQVALEVAEQLVTTELKRATDESDTDAWEQLRAGFQSFLDICTDSDFQRIVLVDGPAVLGHDAWDVLVERYGYRLLAEWLTRAIEEGRIDPLPVMPLTRVLAAVLSEASLLIGRAGDPAQARREAGEVLDRLLVGLEAKDGLVAKNAVP
ncbi:MULTISPECIES: TetR/AcrR family transcriptional regulator [Protofrankia]|uniref:Regulatory protein TetR n=1 Tax=Candidatus Protofrankia datiscae TaxID=2716812 RepID=F8AZJ7_9ACTN|nr:MULTISPECIES: TetR/AcrR family transcriptional regulator [Protofrankia]AEH08674.1 regulatory protein TetR [Candidatus Protofrankia datiscae]